MRIVGADPGLDGGLACVELDDMSVVALESMPTYTFPDGRRVPDARAIFRFFQSCKPAIAVIEQVESRRGAGVTSSFRFGFGFGALVAAAQLYDGDERRVTLARPTTWKGCLGLSSDKHESLAMARELFPDAADMLTRRKDDGRAEALLLCEYHRRVVIPTGEVEVI